MSRRKGLDEWTQLTAFPTNKADGTHLQIPHVALPGFGEDEFPPLLVKLKDDPPERARPATATWTDAPGLEAAQASRSLIDALEAPAVTYPELSIKHATGRDRFRYDANFRAAAVLGAVAIVAAAWAVAGEVADWPWVKIVGASLGLVSAVLAAWFSWHATG